jgi:phage terminase small subunit
MGRADMAEFADVRSPADLEDKLNSHVVKRITVQARRHKDGTITAKTTIELHDAQGALEKLARHLGLYPSERSQNTNLEIDMTELSDEQLRRIADGDDPLVVIAEK